VAPPTTGNVLAGSFFWLNRMAFFGVKGDFCAKPITDQVYTSNKEGFDDS
jgi:hypothetical protein